MKKYRWEREQFQNNQDVKLKNLFSRTEQNNSLLK